MRKLIINLKYVEPVRSESKNPRTGLFVVKKKIYNTLSFNFNSEEEKTHHLSMHSENIKSYSVINYK